jgi:HPr kinase/phosphorylase
LLHGPSGVGKSDLALRLVEDGAALVADDLVWIEQRGTTLCAAAPAHQRGRLFISGIGVVQAKRHVAETRLSMAVRCLALPPQSERGPTLDCWRWGQMALPEIALVAQAPSTPGKLRLALDRWGL